MVHAVVHDLMQKLQEKTGDFRAIGLLHDVRGELDDRKKAPPGQQGILFSFACSNGLFCKTVEAVELPGRMVDSRAGIDPERTEEAVQKFNELNESIKASEKRLAEILALKKHILNYHILLYFLLIGYLKSYIYLILIY